MSRPLTFLRERLMRVRTTISARLRTPTKQQPLPRGALTFKACLIPLILVYLVAFLGGFANGLLHATNKMIQDSFHVSKARVAGFEAAGFVAFFVAPFTYGRWSVEKLGYRWTFIIGLLVKGTGAILFWPFWHYHSFAGLCVGNFIIGSSAAMMETAILAYVAGCGPDSQQEMRIIVGFGLGESARILSTVVAAQVFYSEVGKAIPGSPVVGQHTVAKTKWTYLAVACFIFSLALTYVLVPVPEIEDEAEEHAPATQQTARWVGKPFRKQYLLFAGAATNFIFVGPAGALSIFFLQYAQEADPRMTNKSSAHYKAIAGSFVAVARFTAALVMKKIKPRYILCGSTVATIALLTAATTTRGPPRLYVIMAEHVTKACITPILDSLSLRGLGKDTKKGAALLITTISALAIFVPIFGVIADKTSTRVATALAVGCTVPVLLFSIMVNTYLAKPIDALCEKRPTPLSSNDEAHELRAKKQDSIDSSESAPVTPCDTIVDGEAKSHVVPRDGAQ